MNDRKDLPDKREPAAPPAGRSPSAAIETFVSTARRLAPLGSNDARPRLVFALDATMSRQPTWDLAQRLQFEMFAETEALGGLAVQLVYFRGFDECRASRFVAAPTLLADAMRRIDCRGGQTQIGRVLAHVAREAKAGPLKAMIFVGDAIEEPIDALCAKAGELGLIGVKAFMFQEGRDPQAEAAFREIARLTGGAFARFDAGAAGALAGLLRAAASFATGGLAALTTLADRDEAARRLLLGMGGNR